MEALQLKEDNLLASVKKYLDQVNEQTLKLHDDKVLASQILHFRTEAIDRLVINLYHLTEQFFRHQNQKTPEVVGALLSHGGYGRKELCLQSDIDLVFFHEGKSQEFVRLLNEKMMQNLWDAGLQVGFSTRTLPDCRRLMEEDLTILTSLIDARFLTGDEGLAQKFYKMFGQYFSATKKRDRFFRLKTEENKERGERYGGSVYLLEPNLKEGEGGLRDYHTLYWFVKVLHQIDDPRQMVLRGILSEEELQNLWEGLEFLWRVRNELHRRSGRRVDQVFLEQQEGIAKALGFETNDQFLGVELFMQHYYLQASRVHTLSEKGLRRLNHSEPGLFAQSSAPLMEKDFKLVGGRVTIVSSDVFDHDPLHLLKIFDTARRLGVEIDDFARERIEKSLSLLDDSFRNRPEAGALFREMLREPVGLGKMLAEMNELGVLGAFLPEFQKLRFRVQHDIYHVYTVDMHSIFAVQGLEKVVRGDYATSHPTISQMVQDIERKDLLAFAILYHDIGKGEGSGHVEKGAPLIRQAGERLGFMPAEVDMLEFLERSHLIMTHVAFRRDLEDQNMIIQFAKAMGTMELLNMLYVLTCCDVRAVSAEAMTDWKASLIEYLYLKTREVIQKGAYTKEKVSNLMPKTREEVLGQFSNQEDQIKAREYMVMMPARYLLATPPAMIGQHVQLWEKFLENPVVFEARLLEKEGLNEIALFTWENPKLFSQMTGIFAAHNINIIEAQLNLSNKGHALHLFKVSDSEGKAIDDEERWKRVEKDLREILEGRLRVENLVAEKFRPSLFKKKVARVVPARVDIDNDLSPYYTIIDIYAQDRTGLLYQMTSTLSALGLYVDVSKISTKVDQVADTFYVKDIFGHKIASAERLKKVKEILMKVLEEEPTPGWRPPRL